MNTDSKLSLVLTSLTVLFIGLAGAFMLDVWGHPRLLPSLPPVDLKFIDPPTARLSAADLIRSGGDTSGLDCYACHEKNKPLKLQFDTENNIVLPKEHEDIVMGHGRHKRNNNCFNYHDETNLALLQTRDGHQVQIVDSPERCAPDDAPSTLIIC